MYVDILEKFLSKAQILNSKRTITLLSSETVEEMKQESRKLDLNMKKVRSGGLVKWNKSDLHPSMEEWRGLTTAMKTILKQFQANPPPAFVKVIEEIYVTCGGAHSYYQCFTTDGNTFLELRDNIQGYDAAAIINYNQGNSSYRPSSVANQIRPSSFAQSNMQNNQNRFRQPQGYNQGNNFNQDQSYQVPTQQNQVVPLKEDERVKETLTEQHLAEYTIKEKLLELANTPLNENCLAVILKKLPEKLGDLGKFLILCGFSKLKCKALADLGSSINLMPLSVWKKLGLLELISTRMTLELVNWSICTLAGIARDVFVLVGKFTFPADFVIIDYGSDPRVPLILGRPFLRTTRALIDVHGEEMFLRDGDERLTLNMRHDTSSYSNQPQKESINMINIFNNLNKDFIENLFTTNHQSGNPTFSSHPNLTSPEVKDDVFDPEGGNEFADELTLITFPMGNDDLPFDIEFVLKEIEYILNHDPIMDMDSILEDSVDQSKLDDLNDNLDEYDDDLFQVEFDIEYVYDDLFDSKGEKIKESKLLIDELDLPSDFPPSFEYESFLFKDFSKVDALPSTSNKDKVFNLGILIRENLLEVITRVAPDKNVKKLAISHASLILEDFDHPLYELYFFKEVPELSHRGYKVFKIIKILKSPMEIFLFSHGEDIRILDVPCPYFYPP
uniref:Reverse transcriptase domain-containing protein n=1 Tax=Tanacetum cinerariifolium TaxID=118510 RepID=A0A6L2JFA1_TANCI|nr:reverse transcriptase domain-containing protein [Tanacetum cinerariifolium]